MDNSPHTQPDLSLVVPLYNEVDNLQPLLAEIDQTLGPSNYSYEVLFVDDGSTDGSTKKLAELAAGNARVKVICFRRNYGQSAAFDAGFQAATGRIVVTLDADRQNDPADIPRMVRYMQENHLDFVSGCRARREDAAVSRKLPSRIANFIIRRVTKTEIRDLGCSLKVYKQEIAREVRLYGEMHRFLAVLIEGTGAKVGQMDVNHRARVAGVSKYGLARTFKVLLDLVTVWFMEGFQTNPIYFFGGMSMLLMAGAMLTSAYVAYERIFEGIFVHKQPMFLLSMVMAIVSVQFLAMGLIAEIMIRTYFESRRRPVYSVRSYLGFAEPPASQDDGRNGGV